VAPWQVTPLILEEIYRFRDLNSSTAIYGVIGNPVMHSHSPVIHNRGFSSLGINAVYLPFHVPDLDGFWKVADMLSIRGLSVTVPYKQAVLGPAVQADLRVQTFGACNTLIRALGEGTWMGTNTDGEGFLAPLRMAFGGSIPPVLRVTVIGAGGAARAVVASLKEMGARVLVLNRTIERANILARAFGAASGGLDVEGMKVARDFPDLIVQTTSVGMTPKEDSDPAPEFIFSGREIVYELVYSPQKTSFVRRALKAGCRVVYGRQMLIAQAVRQFQLFTGSEYPPSLLQEIAGRMD
jgi:3-dehydroquinate dehydratase/shikimate dehydrogenase